MTSKFTEPPFKPFYFEEVVTMTENGVGKLITKNHVDSEAVVYLSQLSVVTVDANLTITAFTWNGNDLMDWVEAAGADIDWTGLTNGLIPKFGKAMAYKDIIITLTVASQPKAVTIKMWGFEKT